MKLRRAVLIFGSFLILIIIFTIYTARDLTFPKREATITQEFNDNQWLHFENRIKHLEDDLRGHHNAVDEIKVAMRNMLQPSSSTRGEKRRPAFAHMKSHVKTEKYHDQEVLVTEMVYNKDECPLLLESVPKTNIQMLDLYKSMSFENTDGGVWKQGWRIEVDEKDWNRYNKLKVFVVPHSHNDPGWIKTIEEYYTTQTKHILDNMVIKLPEDPRRKFIWAEISYFAMWWADIGEEEKEKVKRLIRNNQLEIVTGGWVMNDEASSHWLSITHQLTEGHQWLQRNLNFTPKSSWSIDPFGLSSTQPGILKEMGLKNLLIQRVHYSVKKQLASTQQLEFRWRQLWDGTGKTDFFTHMMPFYSYDVPHTCGPDPKICCQFDFKRLPNHGLHCPWRVAPQVITEKNVAHRAELLLDQYRKKSKLFKTNVVLAPLGDDFRYDHPTEWDVQYENYQKLFDYMNSNMNLNVQAQFGTLSDYFNELHKSKKDIEFPTLSGDFFTYADRDDHYFSGYYTSRPFYKRMDRVLLSYLRAAETIHALTFSSGKKNVEWIIDKTNGLEHFLNQARMSLSLFQHHDGITGTAKNHVVIDYGKKMLTAIHDCQKVIQVCTNMLLNGAGSDDGPYEDHMNFYNFDDIRHSHDSMSEHNQITIGHPDVPTKKVVIFNPLTFHRREVVTFYVNEQFVEVADSQKKLIISQISPIFDYGSTMSNSKFQLSFIADIPPLALVQYTITAVSGSATNKETKFASITVFNQYGEVQPPKGFDTPRIYDSGKDFTVQNGKLTASFNQLGLLKSLKVDSITTPIHLDFAKYGVRNKRSFNEERSGAYLFLPDGEAAKIAIENTIVNVVEGPIMSSVTVQLPYVHHTVTIYNTQGADSLGIQIENVVDIEQTNNFELVMRLSTNIGSKEVFFTDVNGYQMLRRERFKKLPIQANYYPIPTMAYIEDKTTRLTILTGSPLGCSSLSDGQIEVMLDRRLNQDDNLGLGQGVLDNHPTPHIFRLLLEHKDPDCQTTAENHPAGFSTLSSHVASQSLLNPPIKLLKINDDEETDRRYSPLSESESYGVDIALPVFKTGVLHKGTEKLGVVVHRQFVDVCYSNKSLFERFPLSRGTVNLGPLFKNTQYNVLQKTSLSFSFTEKEISLNSEIHICPMEIQAFVAS